MIPKNNLIRWKLEAAEIFRDYVPNNLDTFRLWKLVSNILLELEEFEISPKTKEK